MDLAQVSGGRRIVDRSHVHRDQTVGRTDVTLIYHVGSDGRGAVEVTAGVKVTLARAVFTLATVPVMLQTPVPAS